MSFCRFLAQHNSRHFVSLRCICCQLCAGFCFFDVRRVHDRSLQLAAQFTQQDRVILVARVTFGLILSCSRFGSVSGDNTMAFSQGTNNECARRCCILVMPNIASQAAPMQHHCTEGSNCEKPLQAVNNNYGDVFLLL